MATMTATTTPMGAGTVKPENSWRSRDATEWTSAQLRCFLESVLPGHECLARFQHSTGRVVCSLEKEELRRQVKDEEAANVIWAELRCLREAFREKEDIAAHGAEPYIVFIRTPAEVAVELEALPHSTVIELKERVAKVEGTPLEQQRLMWNGVPMLDSRTLASYSIVHGSVILLVPRLASTSRRYAPCAIDRSAMVGGSGGALTAAPTSAIPRPRVPVVCTDIARPFPMSIEFSSIPDYQGFMLALQRQVGRRDMTSAVPDCEVDAPFLEILPVDNVHCPVQTRITFDPDAELLLIDSVGDVLVEATSYRVLLHLRNEQKTARLVTGVRADGR